jgi:hypothetical protein
MSNQIENNFNEEDQIDIIALLKTLWNEKKLIVKTTILFFVIGCVVALTSPVIYMSHTTFVSQSYDSSSSGIGSLASSITGLNFRNSETNDSYVSPALYTKITQSEEFSIILLNEVLVLPNEDRISIKNYILGNSNNVKLNNIKEINKLKIFEDYNFISAEDNLLIREFQSKFSVEINNKEGFIKVTAHDKDAFVSSQIVKLITQNLQSRIISLRTNKIKEQLDYTKRQYDIQKEIFEMSQNNLAEFKDSNKNISTAVFMSDLQKLQAENQLQQSILMKFANEFNINKIKLNKNTPIFSVLDEVSVPYERSKPNRKQIVLMFTFLGFLIITGYVLSKDYISELIKKINHNN